MTPTTDQTNLLVSLGLLRRLLNQPTTLHPKRLALFREGEQNIADRCYYNAGWHAAQPKAELRGSASTAKIMADMHPMIEALQGFAVAKRGRGRPVKEDISEADKIVLLIHLKTGKSLTSIVDKAIRRGVMPTEKTKTTASHVKRIERIIAKLKKAHAPETNNVLDFSSYKKRLPKNTS